LSTSAAVVLTDLSFHWPDGTDVIGRISGSFTPGRTGLIGANGAGKTTLLRLIARELTPTGGSVVTTGVVDYLRQDVTRGTKTVADLLGIRAVRDALAAVEAGSVDPAHFDVIGIDWDVEDRAVAELHRLDLPSELDRPVATLSGGEAMLTAITGIRLRAADVVLLDEPTNNLDREARQRLYEVIDQWRGALITVSHDLELLDRMDATAELRGTDLTTFGGPYAEYRAWLEVQQAAALQSLRSAEQTLKKEKRERIKAEERIAHSARQGRKDRENRKYVAAVLDDRQNSAEKAQGARRSAADAKVSGAREAVAAAELAVRNDDSIRVDLPDPHVPKGRRLAQLPSSDGRVHVIQGPERLALVGPNGVGKTTLVESLLSSPTGRIGYLPQRIVLNDTATVIELVREAAPDAPPGDLRNSLARLLIRGDMVDRTVGNLSGGERFRVALATLLLAEPPPELLILDEPTNDLDLASVDQLIEALDAYRGALLVVSHDLGFLRRLNLTRVLRLDGERHLRVAALSEGS
jgi:ATPase subunit of ABC transporter with duplicated ATPase domains